LIVMGIFSHPSDLRMRKKKEEMEWTWVAN
jgi:hypothetical protein